MTTDLPTLERGDGASGPTEPGHRPASRRDPRRLRLSRRTRRAWLVAHIVAGGAWVGIDVVMACLVVVGLSTGDDRREALCWQAIELFAVWPLFTAGVTCLATGIVLGIGTKYGLVRYWWVAVKLVLNVILAVLILFLLRPGVHDLAGYGRALAGGTRTSLDISSAVMPPIVSLTALFVATVLSVFKPWGRTRLSRRERRRAGSGVGS